MTENGVNQNQFRRIHTGFLNWVEKSVVKNEQDVKADRALVENLPEDLREMRNILGRQAIILEKGAARSVAAALMWMFMAGITSIALLSHYPPVRTLFIVIPMIAGLLYAFYLFHCRNNLIKKWSSALREAKLGEIPLYLYVYEVV